MSAVSRAGLAFAFVATLLGAEWWLSRQLEAAVCHGEGHAFDERRGRCDATAQRPPGPPQWYDRLL